MTAARFLSGRTAWVTGGGSGQGRAIALRLAEAGANVAIGSFLSSGARAPTGEATYYPGEDELRETKRAIEQAGVRAYAAHLDVCETDSVRQFHAAATAALGAFDIAISAAGVTGEQTVCGHSDALWSRVLETNLGGPFRVARCCLPEMIKRGWGRIVNICSTAGMVGWASNPAYCASKSGLLGLTRCIALEGAAHGVTCNAISPTWVETGLMRADVEQLAKMEGGDVSGDDVAAAIARDNPQKRIIQPEETAAMAAWLCGDDARGINAENITLSGGALW